MSNADFTQPKDAGESKNRAPKAPGGRGNGSRPPTAFKPPADAFDLSGLYLDTQQGDPLAETVIHSVPIGKPKDFFMIPPDPAFRRRCMVYFLKKEGMVEEQFYIVDEKMRTLVGDEARPAIITTCVYRDGSIRLWPLKLPREGETDQMAWSSAREAAKAAMQSWIKLKWKGGKYDWRKGGEGYAEPDWKKLPSFDKQMELGFGEHGVIRDEDHSVYRFEVLGEKEDKEGGIEDGDDGEGL
jgi:hypothetical protein